MGFCFCPLSVGRTNVRFVQCTHTHTQWPQCDAELLWASWKEKATKNHKQHLQQSTEYYILTLTITAAAAAIVAATQHHQLEIHLFLAWSASNCICVKYYIFLALSLDFFFVRWWSCVCLLLCTENSGLTGSILSTHMRVPCVCVWSEWHGSENQMWNTIKKMNWFILVLIRLVGMIKAICATDAIAARIY